VSVSVGYNRFTWPSSEARIAVRLGTCQPRSCFNSNYGRTKEHYVLSELRDKCDIFGFSYEKSRYRNLSEFGNLNFTVYKYQGKAIPVQALRDPEGWGLPDFKTMGT
jgi:hypothetical protein